MSRMEGTQASLLGGSSEASPGTTAPAPNLLLRDGAGGPSSGSLPKGMQDATDGRPDWPWGAPGGQAAQEEQMRVVRGLRGQ